MKVEAFKFYYAPADPTGGAGICAKPTTSEASPASSPAFAPWRGSGVYFGLDLGAWGSFSNDNSAS